MGMRSLVERLQTLRALPQPEPMLNRAACDNKREQYLAADQCRRENYGRYLASTPRSEQLNFPPIKLDVEPVRRCNFR